MSDLATRLRGEMYSLTAKACSSPIEETTVMTSCANSTGLARFGEGCSPAHLFAIFEIFGNLITNFTFRDLGRRL